MNDFINPNYQRKISEKHSVAQWVDEIVIGNRNYLSRAITLLESKNEDKLSLGQEILRQIPKKNNSRRIGITGIPGVGKSTFIENFGLHLVADGKKLAVLAIDPSSSISGGSILGDKTRMELLSVHQNVFIRPSPATGNLGGLARNTYESMLLCEAAGFDNILIETVGVGQNEIAVYWLVDLFMLLTIPNTGDELQGIKRGIMELAEIIVINKADTADQSLLQQTKSNLLNALHFMAMPESEFQPKVVTCSAITSQNFNELNSCIDSFFEHMHQNNRLEIRRLQQKNYWFEHTIQYFMQHVLLHKTDIEQIKNKLKNEMIEGKISSFEAGKKLVEYLFHSHG
jgi:LAO/AO transport system kinase